MALSRKQIPDQCNSLLKKKIDKVFLQFLLFLPTSNNFASVQQQLRKIFVVRKSLQVASVQQQQQQQQQVKQAQSQYTQFTNQKVNSINMLYSTQLN